MGSPGSLSIGGGGCNAGTVQFTKNAIMAYDAKMVCFKTPNGATHPTAMNIYRLRPGLTPLLCGCH